MRKSVSIVILSLIIFTSTIFSSKVLIEKSKNPVFVPAQGRQAKNPCVVYDQSGFESADPTSAYKMWFATEDGIALAFSADGFSWTEYNNSQPLSSLHPTADLPYVIYDKDSFGGTNYHYRIWYWSGINDSIEAIRTAESIDGIVWENDRPIQQHPNDFSLQLVTDPSNNNEHFHYCYGPGSILYNPNGTDTGSATPFDKSDDQPMTYRYVMYYNSASDGSSPEGGGILTSLAYSSDGICWIRYGNTPVINPDINIKNKSINSSNNAKVIQSEGKYVMFYFYLNANPESPLNDSIVKTASSNDGINWTIEQNTGLKLKDDIAPVINSVQGCSIIQIPRKNNSKYSIWASVKDETGKYSINYYEHNMKELPGGEYKGINIYSSTGYAPFTFVAWIEQQDWDHELTCYTNEMYWRWDFGDGTVDSDYELWEVNHTYNHPGIYTITATNLCHGIYELGSDTQIVEVIGLPSPIVSCFTTEPATGFAPLEISFNANCSQIPDTVTIKLFGWSFGDGQFAVGYNVKHTYQNPGTYNTLLGIEDSFGSSYYYGMTSIVKGLYAPINITLEKQVNRSLFKGTAKNILKWSPSPRIFQCTVVQYKIYRKLSSHPDSDYQLIATVDSKTFTFTDSNIELNGNYSYVLTAVETGGQESPFSNPVSN